MNENNSVQKVERIYQNLRVKADIERVEYIDTENVVIWLSNEGKIKYYRDGETGKIIQDTFRSDDPNTAWESVAVGGEEDNVKAFALDWVEWYINASIQEVVSDDFSRYLLRDR